LRQKPEPPRAPFSRLALVEKRNSVLPILSIRKKKVWMSVLWVARKGNDDAKKKTV